MKYYINHVADAVLSALVQILGVALLLTVTLQIASRYLPFTIVWTDELSRLLFVWYAMLSISVAYIENKHLSLEILYDKLSSKIQNVLDILSQVLIFMTALLICYQGFSLLKIVSIQKAPILSISMAWFYAAVPVGFLFIVINTFLNLAERFIKWKNPERKDLGGNAEG